MGILGGLTKPTEHPSRESLRIRPGRILETSSWEGCKKRVSEAACSATPKASNLEFACTRFGKDPLRNLMNSRLEMAVCVNRVSFTRALLFGVYIRAPDSCKLNSENPCGKVAAGDGAMPN